LTAGKSLLEYLIFLIGHKDRMEMDSVVYVLNSTVSITKNLTAQVTGVALRLIENP